MSPCSINESVGEDVTVTKHSNGRHLITLSTVFAFCLALFAGLMAADSAEAAKTKPQRKSTIGGYSSIVLDAATGKVLHEDNADAQKYPASLTKMMTLYMIFDALDSGKIKLGTTWKVSSHAAGMSPTKLGLDAGESISVRDVILGLVTKSANDAAAVAAEGLGGTEDNFGDMMTQRARRLGMANTTFQNASGLPDPGQVTTARDMARLSRALVRDFPHYYSYFSTPEFTYAGRRHANHNRLMNWYEGADGIKTGFIRASGFNLAASAVRDNRRVIGVVMGGPSPVARDQYMGKLLDIGFSRMPDLPSDMRHAAAPPAPAPAAMQVASEPPSRSAKARQTRTVAQAVPVRATASEERTARTKTVKRAKSEPETASGMSLISSAHAAAREDTMSTPAGGWAVQVGAFNRIDAARRAAENAAKLAAGPLSDAGIEISSLERKKNTVHRARLVGLSEGKAKEACRILESRKHDCLLMAPTAEARSNGRVSVN
jgi:D-alanyl-D-alanine carboxypeptidase